MSALTRADYALAGALTDDSVYGRALGRQVQPILNWLSAHGWHLVQEGQAVVDGTVWNLWPNDPQGMKPMRYTLDPVVEGDA